jgi:hypothetical protein
MHLRIRSSTFATWAGVAALIGGLLWIVKSLSILIADEQPDFVFEVAPFFFAVATMGVVLTWEHNRGRASQNVRRFASVGVVAGGVAAVADVAGGDELLFGVAIATAVTIVIGLLGYTGRDLRRGKALGALSALPLALALSFLLAIPVGGALEGLNERLLEIPLLLIGVEWVPLSWLLFGTSPRALPPLVEPGRLTDPNWDFNTIR